MDLLSKVIKGGNLEIIEYLVQNGHWINDKHLN